MDFIRKIMELYVNVSEFAKKEKENKLFAKNT